ncbi:MAG: Urea ABC transporter, permease protein UrtC, partial [uncultured Acetobacteraceae bacterium]
DGRGARRAAHRRRGGAGGRGRAGAAGRAGAVRAHQRHRLGGDGAAGALSRLRLGRGRHTVLRANGVLRLGRLRLRCGGHQLRRRRAGGAARVDGGDAGRGGAGLGDVLRPGGRRLHGRHHPHRDADPVQIRQLHGWGAVAHRRRGARRLQWHPADAAAELAGRSGEPVDARAGLRRRGAVPVRVLRGGEAGAADAVRARRGGDQGERAAGGAVGLRRPGAPPRRVHHRRGDGGAGGGGLRQLRVRQPEHVLAGLRGAGGDLGAGGGRRHLCRADGGVRGVAGLGLLGGHRAGVRSEPAAGRRAVGGGAGRAARAVADGAGPARPFAPVAAAARRAEDRARRM